MSRNPLDPYAYDIEEHPFTPMSRRPVSDELQRGVHTTPNEARATVYAVMRASATPSEQPTCGIVFELDTAGLEQLPDVDAVLEAEQMGWVVKEILEEEDIAAALEAGDEDTLGEAISRYVEMTEPYMEGERFDSWREGAWRMLEYDNYAALPYVLARLPEDVLLAVLQEAQETGNLPMDIWAEAQEQYRYMTPIGLARVKRIIAIRPVRPELWGRHEDDPDDAWREEYAPENETQPQVMSETDFYEGSWVPDQVVLWEAKQLPLWADAPRIEYHGTDLTRARSAFPELDVLQQCPWPYGQE